MGEDRPRRWRATQRAATTTWGLESSVSCLFVRKRHLERRVRPFSVRRNTLLVILNAFFFPFPLKLVVVFVVAKFFLATTLKKKNANEAKIGLKKKRLFS